MPRVSDKKDTDPVNYGDFMNFKLSVERRLTALEERQNSMKEDINELKKSIKELTDKMEENNKALSSKIDELKSVILAIPGGNNRLVTGLGVGGVLTGTIAIIILILKAILQVI